jgi:beta-aspartyl-peptidase (threonine type)
MKKAVVLCLAVFAIALAAFGQGKPSPEGEIRAVLDIQQAAWNRGDIEAFMSYYWRSDALTFQSGGIRTHGWDGVLVRYKTNYPPDRMGRLEFADLDVHLLGRDAAFVLGRFRLDQGGTVKEGVFTLIFRRLPEGWRIVHDHTST